MSTTTSDDVKRAPREDDEAKLPMPAPEPAPITQPEDRAYPGTIRLTVDASDVQRGIFQVHELLPVQRGGPMTLLYPKWLPGYHSPHAEVALFAGLQISAGARAVSWRRDPVEVYAFHVEVPEDAESLDIRFQFVSPTSAAQGRVVITPALLNLQWNSVVLYPAGHFARRIRVEAAARLPDGWSLASALRHETTADGLVRFEPAALDVLVDSPVFAGRFFRRVALDEPGNVTLNLVADRPELLEATSAQIEPHRALVTQADRLFGARHFDHYDFLVALSDELGGIGVEHHRSSEIGTAPDYFTEWEKNTPNRDVMSHEYTHSWNGKYRRGEDSWTPTFERPIRNSLMWVYEGQTQYWGNVLSARSGLWTLQQAHDWLAHTAAIFDHRPGRRWRPMSDTTRDPIIADRRPLPWVSWQRSEDYYSEGQLVWLDVDTRIREVSGDTRSLDDFARLFFGCHDGSYLTHTYDFDEVVETLAKVVDFDWASFLTEKLESRSPRAPLDGFPRGGYELVYRDEPSDFAAKLDALSGSLTLKFSIGLTVGSDRKLREVLWESPAFQEGLTPGTELVAVNGLSYEPDRLKHAIRANAEGSPIELLVKNGRHHRTVSIDYREGHRYPHLAPIADARKRLDEILAPR